MAGLASSPPQQWQLGRAIAKVKEVDTAIIAYLASATRRNTAPHNLSWQAYRSPDWRGETVLMGATTSLIGLY